MDYHPALRHLATIRGEALQDRGGLIGPLHVSWVVIELTSSDRHVERHFGDFQHYHRIGTELVGPAVRVMVGRNRGLKATVFDSIRKKVGLSYQQEYLLRHVRRERAWHERFRRLALLCFGPSTFTRQLGESLRLPVADDSKHGNTRWLRRHGRCDRQPHGLWRQE
jgi:hypothetical protein